ncbi:MAG: NFACT family protein [Eubacteriales bacterium]
MRRKRPAHGVNLRARRQSRPPPMLCMLMREHFVGSVFVGATQPGFQRVVRLEFDGRDEMGYDSKKFIYAEVMGNNSNLIFTDGSGKILGAMRQVDFTTSRLRQVLPGMQYELPPAQDKRDPLTETRDGFLALLGECIPERSAAKHINATYLGISPTVAREIAFRAAGSTDATVGGCSGYLLWREFSAVIGLIKGKALYPRYGIFGRRARRIFFSSAFAIRRERIAHIRQLRRAA